ncbi:hypothetical protein GOHSU_04_00170 [Gordonia hirsuta DSM 44140 = NBRC 16056]|uniref:Low molecular weight protein antigen 6 PH domain-containing protein n=1 Tax=Gordonia hirsuta DSM 44140 = NBRC 16056 TaxID=1121927 RepID=L7L7Z7_9ACTN|nr:PH domain-containing protein [Gordonia hirsuta]GAC56148.1 hypothetical protein GOHSU_04_00170 [Gordonia hirsuta DSM 44140 = NBRC 16056]
MSRTRTPASFTFAISRLSYLTVLVTLLVVFMMVGVWTWFAVLLVLPVVQIWWIRRIKTVVDHDGLTAVHTFDSTRVPWSQVAGLQFPRWRAVRAVLIDGGYVRLPAVTFDDLPVLALISDGRVPDPFAAERAARLAAEARD